MPPSYRQSLGRQGEQLAVAFFERKGWKVIARNWRALGAEVDLVCTVGNETVFVEVKTRRSSTAGYPEDAITHTKRQHLDRVVQAWWQERGAESPWRIDVLAIRWVAGQPEYTHFQGI